MSRTRKNPRANSPVKHYFSFKGGAGTVSYWDKNGGEDGKGANVNLDSLSFIVLDTKAAVGGFNEAEASGISSNLLDLMDVGKKEFIIKTKSGGKYGEVLRGIWKDIKAEADQFGGKFTTVIFGLAEVDGEEKIIRLDLNGSALTPWIKLQEEYPNDGIYDLEITISKGVLMKREKGKNSKVTKKEYEKVLKELEENPMGKRPVWFYEPKFVVREITEEEAEKASDADEKLQAYFDEVNVNAVPETSATEEIEEEAEQEANEALASGIPTKPVGAGAVEEEEDDDDDDLPF